MIKVIRLEEAVISGQEPDIEDSDDMSFNNLEMAYLAWRFMRSSDNHVLPDAGGWLDQDESLMTDMMNIQWRLDILRAHDKANKQANG